MKTPRTFVTLIITSIIIIAPFFTIKAQDTTVKNVLENKSYNNTIGWDIFSVNYSYSIFNKKSWSAGITTGVGMGFNIGIIRPYYKVNCDYCDDWFIRKMDPINIELARIGPFVRLNYFKNNYLEFITYISAFQNTEYSDVFLQKPGLAMGGELSIFFGPERLKFGTGVRLSTFFYNYSSNNPANDIVTGLFIRPLIIHYHF